jgi:iron(III) transport system ATP-binding protein
MSPAVSISQLRKSFRRADGSHVGAINDVSLDIDHGEFMVLLGPSGCGKSTLLRSVAGLERPESGIISIGDQVVFDPAHRIDIPPERRPLSMVFQSYALWPHMTAFKNVAYPLQCKSIKRAEIRERVDVALAQVDIAHLTHQRPSEMSGGEQQRVALARALVAGDEVILFDEPLSNVDARVREDLRAELVDMQQRLKFTAVFVTHDQLEAMEMADRISVMRRGSIQQVGGPGEVYGSPNSQYVATFLGAANEIEGEVSQETDGSWVLRTEGRIIIASCGGPGINLGQRAAAILRPELFQLHHHDPMAPNSWQGVVQSVSRLGHYSEYRVALADSDVIRIRAMDPGLASIGDIVWASIPPSHVRIVTI